MRPERGHRRQHFRRVVHLVKLPQHGDIVQQAVRDEAAKIVGDKKHHGVEKAPDQVGSRAPGPVPRP